MAGPLSPSVPPRWRDRSEQTAFPPLTELFPDIALPEAVFLLEKSRAGIAVLLEEACRSAIREHLASADTELGGLLLGQVYADTLRGTAQPLCVYISHSIPSRDCESGHACLVLGTGIWDRARAALDDGLRVIGWYHSHPDLGAFFSGRDRKTQRGFFTHPYSLGLVIDPIRREEKWFRGRDAAEVPAGQVITF
jgi:hypothetical protein